MITTLDAITNELEFGVPKKNTNHYSIHVSAPGTERIMIQSPKMELRENVNLMSDSYADMVCKDTDFLNALKAVDQHMMDVIKSKRDEWFPDKNIDDTFVEVGQVPSVMMKNTVRLRVNKNVEVFETTKQKSDTVTIGQGTPVKCIMHLTGIWFTATRWGLTWNLVQLKQYPQGIKVPTTYTGYMFPDEESDHESVDDIDTEPAPPPGV